jgi:hypothetical protein
MVLCTVTPVEELKMQLQLIPIGLTSALYFIANLQTSFVQQDHQKDSMILAPALTSVHTVCAVA